MLKAQDFINQDAGEAALVAYADTQVFQTFKQLPPRVRILITLLILGLPYVWGLIQTRRGSK